MLIWAKFFFPKAHAESIRDIDNSIKDSFNHELILSILKNSDGVEKVILNTATFVDFLNKDFLDTYFDHIICSDKILNSGEQKVRNLLSIVTSEEKITFVSDSLTEDFALFMFADRCIYVVGKKYYEF